MTLIRYAFAALALAACSPSPAPGATAMSPQDQIRAEFRTMEDGKSAMGELLAGMREGQPELYSEFIRIAAEEVGKGRSAFEAGAAARPVYLERFLDLMTTASDDDINEMLEYTKLQMQHLLDMDVQLCAKAVGGEADERMTRLPRDVLDREMLLMARVLRAGDASGAQASEEEVFDWMDAYVAAHADMAEGLDLIGAPGLSVEDARKVCMANIILLDGLLEEPPEVRAPLFRGLLAIS
jgi:hypothetical protein